MVLTYSAYWAPYNHPLTTRGTNHVRQRDEIREDDALQECCGFSSRPGSNDRTRQHGGVEGIRLVLRYCPWVRPLNSGTCLRKDMSSMWLLLDFWKQTPGFAGGLINGDGSGKVFRACLVTSAKAVVQKKQTTLDSGLRRNDGKGAEVMYLSVTIRPLWEASRPASILQK